MQVGICLHPRSLRASSAASASAPSASCSRAEVNSSCDAPLARASPVLAGKLLSVPSGSKRASGFKGADLIDTCSVCSRRGQDHVEMCFTSFGTPPGSIPAALHPHSCIHHA
eukprot:5688670-Amphidinium_carterae.1